MFCKADIVLLTKIDLLPQLEVDVAAIERNLTAVMPRPYLLPLSARTGAGIEQWIRWLTATGHPRGAACATGTGLMV